MKKTIYLALSFLLIVFLYTSCSGVDPAIWNKEIVDVYNKTVDDIDDFEDFISLDRIGDANSTKSILEKGNQILADLDKSIGDITEKEMPTDAEDYKVAILAAFESMKNQISIGLQFANFTESTSDKELESYADRYDSASASTAKKVAVFVKEQQKFVENKGIENN